MQVEAPWLRQYPPGIPDRLEYPKVPLHGLVEAGAARFPKRAATIFFGAKLSYQELWRRIGGFAAALRDAGVKPGDRVAIMLPNCPQLLIAFYGTLLAGGVAVLTNPLYVERELEHQLNDSGAETIVTLDVLWRRVDHVRRQTHLKRIIITSIRDYLPWPLNVLYPIKAKKEGLQLFVPDDPQVERFPAFLKRGLALPVPADPVDPEGLAILQYTGGTTGISKGAMLSHRNLVANVTQCKAWMKSREGQEIILSVIPFFHVYGLTTVMNLGMATGATLLLVPKFDLEQVLKLIPKYKPTLFPGTPTIYVAVNHHPRVQAYDLSSVKACISGAAPLPVEVQQEFERLTGGKLVEGYGLTEASPVTHCTPFEGERKPGSIGLPWPDTEVKIVDMEQGVDTLPFGDVGELCVRGPQVMMGYWNRPEETAKQISADGWLRTGDIARIDENGWTYIVDRKKDIIIAGGYNIYPREVEEVLYQHPAVLEASVVGVPHEYRGQDVKAYIVLRPGAQVTIEELDDFCRERLARYKVPHHYEFRDSLPKSLVGKVLRRVLQEEEAKRGSA